MNLKIYKSFVESRDNVPSPLSALIIALVLVISSITIQYLGAILSYRFRTGHVQQAFYALEVVITIYIFIKIFGFKNYDFKRALWLHKLPQNQVLPLIIIGAGLMACGISCVRIFYNVPLEFYLESHNSEVVTYGIRISLWRLGFKYIIIVLAASVVEELTCRGLIFGSIEKAYGVKSAIIISSLVVTLFHFNHPLTNLTNMFLENLIIGWVIYKTGTIASGVILHATRNSTVVFEDIIINQEVSFRGSDAHFGFNYTGAIIYLVIGLIITIGGIYYINRILKRQTLARNLEGHIT